MKLLGLVLLFIFIFLAENVLSAPLYGPCDVYIPQFQGGFKFSADLIYLRASVPDLDYALTFDGDLNYNNLNPGYENWSYELSVGYDLPLSGNDFRVNYGNFAQDEVEQKHLGSFLANTLSSLANTPTITDTLAVTYAGIPQPVSFASGSPLNDSRLDFVKGTVDFKINRLDLELGQSIHLSPSFRLRFHSGLTGTDIEDTFGSLAGMDHRGSDTAILSGTTRSPRGIPFLETIELSNIDLEYRHEVKQKSHFSGIGPRFGLDANYHLDIGIGIFADMSSAAYIGHAESYVRQETRSTFTGIVEDVTVLDANPSLVLTPSLSEGAILTDEITAFRSLNRPATTRVVPNLEARFGISFAPYLPCTCSRVYLEAGYMISYYFNAVDRLTDNENGTFTGHHTQDQNYDGIFLKVGMHI